MSNLNVDNCGTYPDKHKNKVYKTKKNDESIYCSLINARSIKNKLGDLETFIASNNLALVCITETWIHENDPEIPLLNLGKFDVYNCNRVSKGGGCAILCDSAKISSKFVMKLNGNGFELVCIDLYAPVDMRIICVYRAPWCNKQVNSELFDYIHKLWTVNMLIVGDFNFPDIDWQRLTASSGGYEFLQFTLDLNFKQLVKEPTRQKNFLDLILTNNEFIRNCEVNEEFSDHLSVLFEIKRVCKIRHKPDKILVTNKNLYSCLITFWFLILKLL